MTKRVISNPFLSILPDTPGTNAKDAAASAYIDITPTLMSYPISESTERVDTTSSANKLIQTQLPGKISFSINVGFNGGDLENDYAIIKEQVGRLQALFIFAEMSDVVISAANPANVVLGAVFDLSLPSEIGSTRQFSFVVEPGPDATDLHYVTDPAVITGTTGVQLGYENAVLPS